jgi:hypothetical protein
MVLIEILRSSLYFSKSQRLPSLSSVNLPTVEKVRRKWGSWHRSYPIEYSLATTVVPAEHRVNGLTKLSAACREPSDGIQYFRVDLLHRQVKLSAELNLLEAGLVSASATSRPYGHFLVTPRIMGSSPEPLSVS